jgi:hypothetical protein
LGRLLGVGPGGERQSFLPWLTATAFLHSIIIQEQRGILKVWNVVLIWATYFLVILGTFTTRSGVLESVHSFARSDVGPYFLGFMIIIIFGFLWLLFDRMPLLRSEQTIDSYASREAAFLPTTGSLPASPSPRCGAPSSPCSAKSSPASASVSPPPSSTRSTARSSWRSCC